MVKAVNCRPFTAEAEVQSQANRHGIYGGKFFSVESYISECISFRRIFIISPTPQPHYLLTYLLHGAESLRSQLVCS